MAANQNAPINLNNNGGNAAGQNRNNRRGNVNRGAQQVGNAPGIVHINDGFPPHGMIPNPVAIPDNQQPQVAQIPAPPVGAPVAPIPVAAVLGPVVVQANGVVPANNVAQAPPVNALPALQVGRAALAPQIVQPVVPPGGNAPPGDQQDEGNAEENDPIFYHDNPFSGGPLHFDPAPAAGRGILEGPYFTRAHKKRYPWGKITFFIGALALCNLQSDIPSGPLTIVVGLLLIVLHYIASIGVYNNVYPAADLRVSSISNYSHLTTMRQEAIVLSLRNLGFGVGSLDDNFLSGWFTENGYVTYIQRRYSPALFRAVYAKGVGGIHTPEQLDNLLNAFHNHTSCRGLSQDIIDATVEMAHQSLDFSRFRRSFGLAKVGSRVQRTNYY